MTPSEDWKRELTEILFARSEIIVLTTLLIFLGAVAIAFLWPPTYAATGSVMLRGKGEQIRPEALAPAPVRSLSLSPEDVASEVQVLTSADLIRETVLRLKAQEMTSRPGVKAAAGNGGQPLPTPKIPPQTLRDEIQRFKKSLVTEIVPRSNVIRVALYSGDPQWAERGLDALLDGYLEFRGAIANPNEQERFFDERAKAYKVELEKVEKQLLDESEKGAATLVDTEMKNNADLKMRLATEMGAVQNQITAKEGEAAVLRAALADQSVQYFTFLDNAKVDTIALKLMEVTAEHATALRSFLPDSERVKGVEANMAELSRTMRSEVQKVLESRESELAGLRAQLTQMQQAIAELEARNLQLQRQAFEHERLLRDAQLMRNTYETFAKKREEASISTAVASGNLSAEVSIVSRAANSAEIIFPRKLWTLILGLIVGVVTGCSLGFVVEYLDHAFKRPSDVNRYAGLPVICSISRY